MADSFPSPLNKKIEVRLRYYEDLGIRLFYRDRAGSVETVVRLESEPEVAAPTVIEEIALPKTAAAAPTAAPVSRAPLTAPVPPAPLAAAATPEMRKTASPFPTLQEELSARFASADALVAGPKD